MKIPLLDLKGQYETIQKEIQAAIQRVLENGQFVLGEEVETFERAFADYCGASEAVGLNSGTTALFLTLHALGIGRGDEVITVSQTFVATAEAISWTGARPVFVDIDEKTFTMNPALVEKSLTTKTKAIIPVHLYGHPVDMDPILAIAKKMNLFVIEDAAQAHGALYKGKRVGSFGHAACFSFYPTKNLGAYGEGGAVVTSDKNLALKLRKLRNHGGMGRYVHEFLGTNARLEALQAAVLGVKLRHLDKWNEQRRKKVEQYRAALKGLDLKLPEEASWAKSVWHVFAIRSPKRDALSAYLNEKGIATQIYYPTPNHLLNFYRGLGYKEGDLPSTEKIAREILALPLFPEMTEAQIKHVAQAVRAFEGKKDRKTVKI